VREFRTLGSARGAACKGGSYRDRALLQVHVVSPPAAHQRSSGALGHAQVQTVAPTRKAGGRAAGGSLPAIATVVRSLALRTQTWWLDNGSRVSREV
jgi:hypothetical protein